MQDGGTFRIGFAGDVPAIDPAQAGPFTRGEIASLTCVTPLSYPRRDRRATRSRGGHGGPSRLA